MTKKWWHLNIPRTLVKVPSYFAQTVFLKWVHHESFIVDANSLWICYLFGESAIILSYSRFHHINANSAISEFSMNSVSNHPLWRKRIKNPCISRQSLEIHYGITMTPLSFRKVTMDSLSGPSLRNDHGYTICFANSLAIHIFSRIHFESSICFAN